MRNRRVASGESMENSQPKEFAALCFVWKNKGVVKPIVVDIIYKVQLYSISKLQGLSSNALYCHTPYKNMYAYQKG